MRHLYFSIASIIGLSVYYEPLKVLVGLSFSDSLYSHLLLIPLVSLYILTKIRLRVFAETSYAFGLGVAVGVGVRVGVDVGVGGTREMMTSTAGGSTELTCSPSGTR